MRRLVVAAVLCLVCAGLVVGFGARFNGTAAYPDPATIDADYEDHVGETRHLWGVVAGERDGAVVVESGPLRLTVTAPPPSAVEPGDGIQVYGRLAPDRRMETIAHQVQSSERRAYLYAVSLVGGLVAAGAFLRRWRVDVRGLRFVPRED